MKFIEIGIGNTWIVRTEIELEDGSEFEERGIIGPIILKSVYLRIWLFKTVVILDSKEGLKKLKKKRNSLKLVLGIQSK
ncbi:MULTISPECIES: DUF3977 family protein [unclassified Viridibacillus]|uniref:DUF3977 family protein n=1 Tax=unclassified Viridibacillus TaxID=2617942 RepID=UPI00096C7228|nr:MULTISPECIES: DUF3977 family protein [unclassified Viridibacillus]OMC82686.1 hypothetical protein BK128_19840 [Viridibacillus sp. FSL H7-0596]OMC84722.1 hypothetical protein BK130_03655 [Viridibacillus sp. FSL H8-0123]